MSTRGRNDETTSVYHFVYVHGTCYVIQRKSHYFLNTTLDHLQSHELSSGATVTGLSRFDADAKEFH